MRTTHKCFKNNWRISRKELENILRTSQKHLKNLKDISRTSWGNLENILRKSREHLEEISRTSWGNLENILRKSREHLKDKARKSRLFSLSSSHWPWWPPQTSPNPDRAWLWSTWWCRGEGRLPRGQTHRPPAGSQSRPGISGARGSDWTAGRTWLPTGRKGWREVKSIEEFIWPRLSPRA